MKKTSKLFKLIDALFIAMTILPFVFGIGIKALTNPLQKGIYISGASVFFVIKMPFQNLPITEAQLNSVLVIISIFFLCLFLTHGIQSGLNLKRQHIAELIVEKTRAMVEGNMGEYFEHFSPFIFAILTLSAFSSLTILLGLYPPTADLNVVAGWSILVFFIITYYKMKCGPVQYLKSFASPPLMAPLNIISEIATPVSMAFRHYGNVLSGLVISVLVSAGLRGLSDFLVGNFPWIGSIPILQIGLPAILSIYFDIFSGCLQAYIFAMLTMLYVSGGFPVELYKKRKKKNI